MSDPFVVIPSHPLSTEELRLSGGVIRGKDDFWNILRCHVDRHLLLYHRTSDFDRTAEILETFLKLLDKIPEPEGRIVLIREIQFLSRHDRPKLKQLKDYLVYTLLNACMAQCPLLIW
jgi:hypothetical protein